MATLVAGRAGGQGRRPVVGVAIAILLAAVFAWEYSRDFGPTPVAVPIEAAKTEPAAAVSADQASVTVSADQAAVTEPAPAVAVDPWADAPKNISMSVQLPSWAGCPQHPCKYTSLTDGSANMSIGWTGQWQEDEWIYNHLFFNKRDGFFLEMGAMAGTWLSNTHWLSQAAGWKGLLIEACPEQYTNLTRNRPNDICVNAAVCAEFMPVHWISKTELGGILEFFPEGLMPPGVDVAELPVVPCLPLQFILDKFGIAHIDLWSLDVEGAELEVLSTVDFDRLTINAMVVETDGINPDKDAQVVDLLKRKGFVAAERGPNRARWTRNGQNTFFVHRSFLEQRSYAEGKEALYVDT